MAVEVVEACSHREIAELVERYKPLFCPHAVYALNR
jgi:metal-dependent hydrolase (beta-lactamase superfamily II)